MSPRLAFAIGVAVRAGRGTLAHFQTGTVVDIKSDQTPVTIADREAERLIRSEIASAFPGEAILGEEEGATGQGLTRWVLDPIDGTKSFICGVPLYATLLAYEEEGEPVVGVCYFPALDELLYAERGQGTIWVARGGTRQVHEVDRISAGLEADRREGAGAVEARVSGQSAIKGAVIASGSGSSMAKAGRTEGFRKLEAKAMAARTWSDAYGHALVATGRVVAMIDPIVARWDISAMAIIVREAGGRFTDFRGNDALGEEALSSNGLVHEELMEAFAG